MKISQIIQVLEQWAPPALQESYDNAGLLTGSPHWNCTGILVSLDATEEVTREAREKGCNLIVAHHPIIFGGLKSLTGRTYVERAVIRAIKEDVAIYAIHTNLDHVWNGVNAAMADRLGLVERRILAPRSGQLRKLFTFVPPEQVETVRSALFAAGGGHIGNYSECSFETSGTGTFLPESGAQPHTGTVGSRFSGEERKLEVIFPSWLEGGIVQALKAAHPYEEVAYDIISLNNDYQLVGAGMLGKLSTPLAAYDFLQLLKKTFDLPVIRHTRLPDKPIHSVALCGGAGSFLTKTA
ncbi:MAG TPA: Nif3-like dinuclear metal center hexameric protein, partial [Lacibacter sp.]|nr:Nif3-like dinuclear metal center hexameric protein [Lacibacter sp.]